VWVKNDSVSHPTLSFKDRVVTTALNAAHALGLATVGCASTGNLANAVAAHAARAGLPAWIFLPESLEHAKIAMSAVYGSKLVRVRGNYDDVNRLCTQVADRFGWGIVNVNRRTYYGEGSKTVAFEISEQLGWRLPTAVVAPMAGGALVTRLHKGFREFVDAGLVEGPLPRLFGAQAEGCAPIVRLVERGGATIEPVVPNTIARSLAIGNPADGLFAAAAIRQTGGWAAAVSDDELVRAIRLLAETTGVFTETAGGVTLAAAIQLAQQGPLQRSDEVVLCITGNGLKTLDALGPGIADTTHRATHQSSFRPGGRSRARTPAAQPTTRTRAPTELTGGTMSVTLHLPTVLSRLADGRKAIEIDGATVRDVIDRAATQFPQLAPRLRDEQGQPYAFVTFYLNDDDIRLRNGFDTAVEAGDELTVVPAIAGG
jgi:threonine synthase